MSVVLFPGKGKRSPAALLDVAKNQGFSDIIVIGRNGDSLDIIASYTDRADVFWDIMQAAKAVQD